MFRRVIRQISYQSHVILLCVIIGSSVPQIFEQTENAAFSVFQPSRERRAVSERYINFNLSPRVDIFNRYSRSDFKLEESVRINSIELSRAIDSPILLFLAKSRVTARNRYAGDYEL